MKQLYGIGEVAKLKNLTIKALRYYHEVGIIVPTYIDPDSGYRYYTSDQFLHMDIVKYCRSVGVSIKELQRLFEVKDTGVLMRFLREKKAEIEDNMRAMEQIMADIDAMDDIVTASNQLLRQQEVMVQTLPARTLVILPCERLEEENELVAYSKMKKLVEEHGLWVSEYGRGYHFVGEHTQAEYVFGVLQEVPDQVKVPLKVLPEGQYLVLSYTNESQEEQVIKLKAYMEAHGIVARTFIEVDLMTDFFNPKSYSCQLQMPLLEK